MKILEIIPNLQGGGAERLVVELSNEFAKNPQVKCKIVSLYDAKENEHLLESITANVSVTSLRKKHGFDWKLFWRINSVINEFKPDVIHTHLRALIYLIPFMIFRRRIKFFHTIHTDAFREAGSGIQKFMKEITYKCRLCTPVTISKESNISFQKCYKRQATIIENSCSQYKEDKNFMNPFGMLSGKVIVHISSIQPVKNQLMMIEAFKKLIAEGEDVNLIILGRMGLAPEIDRAILRECNEKIHYWGEVSNPRDYMKYADAFCLSSKMEGMPMTIIEAFSVGCIPLCTPVGGCINMIENGENGMLSEDASAESYYKMLKQFIVLPQNRIEKVKQNSKDSFARYNVANKAQEYINLFKAQ